MFFIRCVISAFTDYLFQKAPFRYASFSIYHVKPKSSFRMSKHPVCFIFTLLLILTISLCGCGADKTGGNGTIAETTLTASFNLDATVEITGYWFGKDSIDEPVLVVDYQFTNNTDAPASFAYLCNDIVYQDGILCGNNAKIDGININQAYRNVNPGASFKITRGYKLHNLTSAVEINVAEWLGGGILLRQVEVPEQKNY